MLVPLKWLRQYVDITTNTEDLLESLTMSGTKVEAFFAYGTTLQGVFAGKILSIEKHPNADKLVVLQVDLGDSVSQIVTGATNCFVGAMVPVVTPGHKLPNGVKIKESELRGIKSQGMLCSAEELGLSIKEFAKDMQDGIIILPEEVAIGADINEVLSIGDEVIELELTSNRPDCLSMIGIAREVAAITGKTVKIPENSPQKAIKLQESYLSVTVEDEKLCPRYMATLVKDITIKPSPIWMQNALRLAGMRPINNIVDITNYVMLEYGQPLHAFDYDTLKDGKIIVRNGKKGEKLTTLDGVERDITPDMLVIADSEKPVALAGVMGGLDSEITANTKYMLLESANFNSDSIRSTAKKLNLRSEASMRFEKGVDDHLSHVVADRVLALIEELEIGTVVDERVDVYRVPSKPYTMTVSLDRINKILGIRITKREVEKLLTSVGIAVLSLDPITLEIPTYRKDIRLECDILEEVIRLYGFDKVESTMPKDVGTMGKDSIPQAFDQSTREILSGFGLHEIQTYSFLGLKLYDKATIPEGDRMRNMVKIMNPLGEEYAYMRTTLAPQMLQTIGYNLNRGNKDLKLFEINRIYIKDAIQSATKLPREINILCMGITESAGDFFTLKGYLEEYLEQNGLFDYAFHADSDNTMLNPVRAAKIIVGGATVGVMGEVSKEVTDNFDIDEKVCVLEINLDAIRSLHDALYKIVPLPKFQAALRDIAILVEDHITNQQITEVIQKNGGKLLESIKLFDVYKNEKMGTQKSMAYALTLRHKERTLEEGEINKTVDKIVRALETECGASLRQ